MTTGVVILAKDGYSFGPLSVVFTGWLPEVWLTMLAICAILAAFWAVGFLLARWRRENVAAAENVSLR